jgi:hypothetical protein
LLEVACEYDQALAVDDHYATAVDTPLTITTPYTLIPFGPSAGALWQFSDQGIDLGSTWKEPGSPPLPAVGSAPLGRGYSVSQVLASDLPTVYFKRTFTVADAAAIGRLTLRLQRDDAAAVWLNGVEIFRSNLPGVEGDGTLTYQTLPVASGEFFAFLEYDLTPAELGLLVDGQNLLAVELHNLPSGPGVNYDSYFNLDLVAQDSPLWPTLKQNDQAFDLRGIASDPVRVTVPPEHGQITALGLDGSFTYVPEPGFRGVDTFRYVLVVLPEGPGEQLSTETLVTIQVGPPAEVVGRHLLYNNSKFDGFDAAAAASDDTALAPDKAPLLPGQTASFANYTSYSRGINALVVDVAHLAGVPGLADFEFRVGNNNAPGSWAPAPPPTSISVRPGAGAAGSDRLTLLWPDGAIRRQWLQVTLLPTAASGLAAADVFYFGNAVGETGNSPLQALVNAADEIGTRINPRSLANPAPIDFRFDFNRDGLVNATDQLTARTNTTTFLTGLALIVPAPGGGGAALADAALVDAGLPNAPSPGDAASPTRRRARRG